MTVTMQGITDLYIATNLEDLKRLAYPEKLGKNPKALEKAIKNLYQEIFRDTSDQEKCYILCLRYIVSIETLCRIGDSNFIKLMYDREISRVTDKINELRPILEKRYKLQKLQQIKDNVNNKQATTKGILKPDLIINKQLFPGGFISVKELFQAIQDNKNILIVDIRPASEYLESKIKFENIINIPEDVIAAGLSANKLGLVLKDDTQKIWDKRDSFDALVFLDWNSGPEDMACTKLKYLQESVVDWDCLRTYKQHPVVLNGGFRDFLDSYPTTVTNVHINFIRNNEDIDELLELDGITYPEPDQNVSIMPLKQFTIEELEQSTKSEEISDEDIDTEPEEIPSSTEDKSRELLGPKGGGASIDKPLPTIKDEPVTEIKDKIEEQRLRLLMEARNKKNKATAQNDIKDNFIEHRVGDEPEIKIGKAPPVRRETKPKKVDFVFGGWCGLVNIKNTCYMNTVLQCLKSIPIIRSMMHSYFNKFITRHPPQIMNEFATVMCVLCEGTETDKKVFRPNAFYDNVCRLDSVYKKGNHEDCMEFFLFLFNHLNDDCSYDIKKKTVMIEREKAWYNHLQGRTSFWVDLFYHQFKSTKICQACYSKADSYETDNTLMLPVPYRPGLRMVHLRDLVNEYLEDNQILDYKCSKCQNFGVVNKKDIVVAPEILVLVLKRYYQDEYQETRKNNVCVDFDLKFTFGQCSYQLYSVAQHRGTMDHGHYTAHGMLENSTWVEFNDERAQRFSGDWDSIRGTACAFFYCKENRK